MIVKPMNMFQVDYTVEGYEGEVCSYNILARDAAAAKVLVKEALNIHCELPFTITNVTEI